MLISASSISIEGIKNDGVERDIERGIFRYGGTIKCTSTDSEPIKLPLLGAVDNSKKTGKGKNC